VAQSERPDKRLFRLTAAGRATLRAWLDEVEPIEPEDRDGILLKLFFGAYGDPEAGQRQLHDYRRRVQDRLATYADIEAAFDGEEGAAALRRLQSLRFGMALMRASLEWADETLGALETTTVPARP
jgi:PadR family transcriptional regulator AphA